MGLLLSQISAGRRGDCSPKGGWSWPPRVSQEPRGPALSEGESWGGGRKTGSCFQKLKESPLLLHKDSWAKASACPKWQHQQLPGTVKHRCPPCKTVCLPSGTPSHSWFLPRVWGLGFGWACWLASSPSYLFIHSFQYTKHFITAMETFVTTEVESRRTPGWPRGVSNYVAQMCGIPFF